MYFLIRLSYNIRGILPHMKRVGDKRLTRHPAIDRAVLVVLLVVLGVLMWGVWGVYGKYHESKIKKDILAKEFGGIAEREALLREKLERLSTPRGMEEEIRSKFQVARAGESVLVIVNPEEEEATSSPTRTVWDKVLDFFWF